MWEAYARLKPPPPSREEEKWRREEEERRILERSGRSLVPPPPAEVSMNLRDADTPALVLDLDALVSPLEAFLVCGREGGGSDGPLTFLLDCCLGG